MFLLLLFALAGGSGHGVTYCKADPPERWIPACAQDENKGYLPTPSPCQVKITDPRTGKVEYLVVRLLGEPKLFKPGKYPLQDFYSDRRRPWWRWALLALLP